MNPFCPKHSKIINFIFTLLFVSSKRCYEGQKEISLKIKNLSRFPTILGIEIAIGLRLCFCRTSNLCHFCFLNHAETKKQNLQYKRKISLLAPYFYSFSANNFGILFIIIICSKVLPVPSFQAFNLFCQSAALYQNIPYHQNGNRN